MGEMSHMIKETDKKAQEAQELVKQQSAALDQAEHLGIGGYMGYATVLLLLAGGAYVAIKFNLFTGGVPPGTSTVASAATGRRLLTQQSSSVEWMVKELWGSAHNLGSATSLL